MRTLVLAFLLTLAVSCGDKSTPSDGGGTNASARPSDETTIIGFAKSLVPRLIRVQLRGGSTEARSVRLATASPPVAIVSAEPGAVIWDPSTPLSRSVMVGILSRSQREGIVADHASGALATAFPGEVLGYATAAADGSIGATEFALSSAQWDALQVDSQVVVFAGLVRGDSGWVIPLGGVPLAEMMVSLVPTDPTTTPTPLPTSTPTADPSATPSSTPTPTVVTTTTATTTATATPTGTVSPTETPTGTPSPTETPTGSPTETPTPSGTFIVE